MPLFKSIKVNSKTSVHIWKITEDAAQLAGGLFLTPASKARAAGMKSLIHRCGFLSVRHLLALENYADADLFYDQWGKPHLGDGRHVSITHSFDYAAIIVSDMPVGIDIEKVRPKIVKIASKFIGSEWDYLDQQGEHFIRHLTAIWCAKESLYKMFATPGLSFKNDLHIPDFHHLDITYFGECHFDAILQQHELAQLSLGEYHCSYTIG